VFQSDAFNLVSQDVNAASDIFIHDRVSGETTRMSVHSNGVEASAMSFKPSLSDDARYIAFLSLANNLDDFTKNCHRDAYVHDRLTGQTSRLIQKLGQPCHSFSSMNLALSGDGTVLALESVDPTLVSNDTNNSADIFLAPNPLDLPLVQIARSLK